MDTIGNLGADDIGRRVVITTRDVRIEGRLTGLRVDTEWIEEWTLADPEPERVAGGSRVEVSVGEWSAVLLPSTHARRLD